MKSGDRASMSSSTPRSASKVEVVINVYDLLPPGRLSSALWMLGSSLLHSGVVIRDREYAYGGHDRAGLSGVYWTAPRMAPPGTTFRMAILHGYALRTNEEIDDILREVSEEFLGPSYDLLHRNCNHFTSTLCQRLTSKPAPRWLNRAARIGDALPCVVPQVCVEPPDYEAAAAADCELVERDYNGNNDRHKACAKDGDNDEDDDEDDDDDDDDDDDGRNNNEQSVMLESRQRGSSQRSSAQSHHHHHHYHHHRRSGRSGRPSGSSSSSRRARASGAGTSGGLGGPGGGGSGGRSGNSGMSTAGGRARRHPRGEAAVAVGQAAAPARDSRRGAAHDAAHDSSGRVLPRSELAPVPKSNRS